jgi:DUF2931 family protein
MPSNSFSRAVLAIVVSITFAACSTEPREYDFGMSVAGGPKGWPVWVEELVFDETWSSPGGSLRGGFDHAPPGGAIAILGPKPAPSTVNARWFSYRTQTFYEVTFSLPDDLDEKLRKWYREFPNEDYRHHLIVGFSGKGEALAWWSAVCVTCDYGHSDKFSTPLVEDVMGEVVQGNPDHHSAITGQHVDEGTIPPPQEWLERRKDSEQ